MRLTTRRPLPPEARSLETALPELEAAGGWRGIFGRTGPLTLEIGIGKDLHLFERASLEPAGLFVGIEYTRKKIEKALAKLARSGAGGPSAAGNLRLVHVDIARALEALFPEAGLARVYILFPDPWPKKRHHRRRIVNPEFIGRLCGRLAPGGLLEVRTDDPEYAAAIAETLAREPRLANRAAPRPWLPEPLDPADHVPTLFETKYRERGLAIHHFYAERRPE